MKLKYRILASLVATSMAYSQTTSEIVGYTTQTLETGYNLVGLNLHNSVLVKGTFESELVDDEADFDSVLTDTDAVYILEILSGDQEGATAEFSSADAIDSTINLSGELGAGAAEYQIRKAKKLSEVVSLDNIQTGTTAIRADRVLVFNAGSYDSYYYSSSKLTWLLTTDIFGSNPVDPYLSYSDAVIILRLSDSTADEELVSSGTVKTESTVITAFEGFTPISVSSPAGQTLNNSGLQEFLTSGRNSLQSDIVYIPSNSGYDQYYYNSNNSVWTSASSIFTNDAGDTELPNAVYILRRSSNSIAGLFSSPLDL
ncbi:hypothetical protein OAB00_04180 [Akkermansiaceae bacterium]|nr:hypothetical protein [Akkermansiaceae bacterium]